MNALILGVVVTLVFLGLAIFWNTPKLKIHDAAITDRDAGRYLPTEQVDAIYGVAAENPAALSKRTDLAKKEEAARKISLEAREELAKWWDPRLLLGVLIGVLVAEWVIAFPLLADTGWEGPMVIVGSSIVGIVLIGITSCLYATVTSWDRSPTRRRFILAAMTGLIYAGFVGAIGFVRYLQLDLGLLTPVETGALVLLTVIITSGPAFIGDWAIRELRAAGPTWQRVRHLGRELRRAERATREAASNEQRDKDLEAARASGLALYKTICRPEGPAGRADEGEVDIPVPMPENGSLAGRRDELLPAVGPNPDIR